MVAQGWCPSTHRIYDAPDGGLARVKVPGGILAMSQVRALATAARRFGNGTIEITSRANLQLRGIDHADATHLRAHLRAVALSAPTAEMDDRRNVLASPTAGLVTAAADGDDHEVIDVRPAVTACVGSLDALDDVSALAHKFGVLIDGGGNPSLRAIALDLSLGAVRVTDRDDIVFAIALGEALDRADRDVGVAATHGAVASVVAAAARLCAAPPHGIPPGRMVDVVRALGHREALAELGRTAPLHAITAQPDPSRARQPAGPPLGIHCRDGDERAWIGLRSRKVPLVAEIFDALADVAATTGATEVRLTPWRSVILAELPAADAPSAVTRLVGRGWTDEPGDEPGGTRDGAPVEARPVVGTRS